MAAQISVRAKENRRISASRVDMPFLGLVLLLLTLGLVMLYSASYAQSEYDTGYEISTRYLQKQAVCAVIGLAAMFLFSGSPRHCGTGLPGRCTGSALSFCSASLRWERRSTAPNAGSIWPDSSSSHRKLRNLP